MIPSNTPILRWIWLPALLLVLGCSSGPPPRVYVLELSRAPAAGVTSNASRPVVELRPVTLPDYLDTTDIVLRDGTNELKPSRTGRWGERLSVGVTRALAEALTARMPNVVVDQGQAVRQPARTLLIDIDAFDVAQDARSVLTAHWTILGEDRQNLAAGERATVITSAAPSSGSLADANVVAAMSDAVTLLADHIASDLSRTLGRVEPRAPARR